MTRFELPPRESTVRRGGHRSSPRVPRDSIDVSSDSTRELKRRIGLMSQHPNYSGWHSTLINNEASPSEKDAAGEKLLDLRIKFITAADPDQLLQEEREKTSLRKSS